MLDNPPGRFALSESSSEEPPLAQPSPWPIMAAGAAGLVALGLVAMGGRLDLIVGLAAAALIVGATAVCVFAADRSGEARYRELMRASAARA